MRPDLEADSQPVTNPKLRRAYLHMAETFTRGAEEAGCPDQRQELIRHAQYFAKVAGGLMTPLQAEAQVRTGYGNNERPMDPDKLPPVPTKFAQALPPDPAEAIRLLRSDIRFLEFTSMFTEKEWPVVCLIDGYRKSYDWTAAFLKITVRQVESRYASARSRYTPARKVHRSRKKVG